MIPGDTAAEILKIEMDKVTNDGKEPKRFLLDGFPRTEDNIAGWDRILSKQATLEKVLFLSCSEETMIARIKSRAAADGAQARSDDNEETMRKRFAEFQRQSLPIIEKYEKDGVVVKIDASKTAEEVYDEVKGICVGVGGD